ncbi:MAG: glycine betaine/L-proline ABC transporter ATP-binding protein [Deltaproteobacteria bacterium]|nr:MAG: glycine betaine/L-proline ABC transporter ATP-binding protein [Deltaproteobacteria bacterium]
MNSDVKISCRDVWKVFGEYPPELFEKLISCSDEAKLSDITARCTVAVREANLDIQAGEIFVVMGLSGSGKSTLIRCLNRLIEPSRGDILVDGANLSEMNKQQLREVRQKKMGMVFQHFALLPHRTVIDNVALGLEIQGFAKEKRYTRGAEALELVGLSDWDQSYPSELSGGMQQRVGLARALAVNPEILLMDEAFSALDPLIRQQMQDEFLKLVAIVKKTIVFITHDLDEALKLADRIAVMKDGVIVQVGTPEEIVMYPADEYVSEFVSSVSRTKVISAKNMMMEPDTWISVEGEDPIAVLNKMRKHNRDSIFITDSTNRLVGVVNKQRLAENLGGDVDSLRPITSKNYSTVLPDTSLEDLISEAAQTKSPIAVLDEEQRLLGVISRASLLKELADVV